MSVPAVEIDHIEKRFRRYKQKPTTLKARMTRRGIEAEEFLALSDVSYKILPGSTVGLIGPNGSGKTTLLKIIAGILRPSEGSVVTRGRIAALLELGAGFHQELTGRENVYLNASILGLSKKNTDAVFDDIVAFAELEDFIDTQVKFYSSGMFVRLGFAVAVHVDPEILLIDEVLAVGDVGFQQKCLERINSFKDEGRTIILVTHVVDQVRQICTEAMMLTKGVVHASGSADDVVREYRRLLLQKDVSYAMQQETKAVEVTSVQLLTTDGSAAKEIRPGEGLKIMVDVEAHANVADPVVSLALHDQHNVYMYGWSTADSGVDLGSVSGKRRLLFELGALPYTSGKYWLTVAVTSEDHSVVYDLQEQRYTFDVPAQSDNPPVAYIPTTVTVEAL
jgi:ABC-type polysaccharide/polyol phosphate transport system ATPase subunit